VQSTAEYDSIVLLTREEGIHVRNPMLRHARHIIDDDSRLKEHVPFCCGEFLLVSGKK
jgi:hypothetical protein